MKLGPLGVKTHLERTDGKVEQSPDATASLGLAVSHGLLEAPYSAAYSEQCCLEALGAVEVADAPLLF